MYKVLGVEVEVGDCTTIGSLCMYPLVTTKTDLPPYLTGPEASALGNMEAGELDPPHVPLLAITNLAGVPILLVEGEMLVGGDQNRTMNVTVLCPANEVTIVPVSCVEVGRWGARRLMASTGRHASGSLRPKKTRSQAPMTGHPYERMSDQGEVWQSVESISYLRGTESNTGALEDVHREAEIRIASELEGLTPRTGQTGGICTIDGKVVGMDLFDRPETLEHYFRGIIAGHALDALDNTPGNNSIETIEEFLAHVDASSRETGGGVGLGEEIVFRGDISGVGLTFEGALVHVAAFPAIDDNDF